MLFWVIVTGLTICVATLVARPLLRASDNANSNAPEVDIYKAQLAEVDRDLARDVLDAEEAERARTEIARRLLAASKADSNTVISGNSTALAVAIGAIMLTLSGAIYWQIGARGTPDQPLAERFALADELRENRPSQAEMAAQAPDIPPPETATEEHLASVAELRALMPERPDDLKGWELLAYHESELRNFSAAAEAQINVLRIKADEATVLDMQRLLDLYALAANGQISPEAEQLIRLILVNDETNIAARYHLGALYDQTGRSDIAFRLWRPLVETGPDSYHSALAKARIEGAAARTGIDYTIPLTAGPSAADIANAEQMSPEDRDAMVRNMVAGLADRLANEGGPVDDWARLITAYGVLGETDTARAIWGEAQTVFRDPEALALLTEAAKSAGLTE